MTVGQRQISLFKSYSDNSDCEAVLKVLKRGLYWAQGSEIEEFENKIANYLGRNFAISFNSGTSALVAALLAYGVEGGEVIVPSFTFAATANSVVAVGARPVFADIKLDSLALSAQDVRRKITQKIKAIIPIHFGGDVCCEIKAIEDLGKEYQVPLIEDAAHSLGASMQDTFVGCFGDSAMFSFCFNKILTTGEGGMIVTDNKKLKEKLQLIRSHGRSKIEGYITYGFNFRMSTMTATLGISQFEKLDWMISKRRQLAVYLNEKLKTIPGLQLPSFPKERLSVYQMYNLRFNDENVQKELKKFLEDKGIPTRITYEPLHLTPYYTGKWGTKVGDLPVTEDVSKKILTLPFHLGLETEDLDYMIEQIKRFFKK